LAFCKTRALVDETLALTTCFLAGAGLAAFVGFAAGFLALATGLLARGTGSGACLAGSATKSSTFFTFLPDNDLEAAEFVRPVEAALMLIKLASPDSLTWCSRRRAKGAVSFLGPAGRALLVPDDLDDCFAKSLGFASMPMND
jgi:hypothetical protein